MHIADVHAFSSLLQRHISSQTGISRLKKRVGAFVVISVAFWQFFRWAVDYFDNNMLAVVAGSLLILPLILMLRCLIEACPPRHV